MKRKVTVLLVALIVSVGLGTFSGYRTNARAQETAAQPQVLTDAVADEAEDCDRPGQGTRGPRPRTAIATAYRTAEPR